MGLIDTLQGLKVCIDTAPFIYFIEKHEKYLPVLKPLSSYMGYCQMVIN